MILTLKIMKHLFMLIAISIIFLIGSSLEYSYADSTTKSECESWETRQEIKKEYEELAKSILSDWIIDRVIVECNGEIYLTAKIPQFSDDSTQFIVTIDPKYDLREKTTTVNDFLENRNEKLENLISKIKSNQVFEEIDEKFAEKNVLINYGKNDFSVSGKNDIHSSILISLSAENDNIYGFASSNDLEFESIHVLNEAKKHAEEYFLKTSSECKNDEQAASFFSNIVLMYATVGINYDGVYPQSYSFWISNECSTIKIKINSDYELIEIEDIWFHWWFGSTDDEKKDVSDEIKSLSNDQLEKLVREKYTKLTDWYHIVWEESIRIDIAMDKTINLHQMIHSEDIDEQYKRKLQSYTIEAHSSLYSISEDLGNIKPEIIKNEIKLVYEIFSEFNLILVQNSGKIPPSALADLMEKSDIIQEIVNTDEFFYNEISASKFSSIYQFQETMEMLVDFLEEIAVISIIIEEFEERGYKVDVEQNENSEELDLEITINPIEEGTDDKTIVHTAMSGVNMLETEFLMLASAFSSQGYSSLSFDNSFSNISNNDLGILENQVLEPQKYISEEMTPEIRKGMMENLSPEFKTPRQQTSVGILPSEVQCKEELVLILKSSDGSPACVKPETAEKLIERGWVGT